MEFNLEKGLVGMGKGFLSGYSTLLSQKSEQALEQKKQEAQLQRDKSLAKYKSDILQAQKTEQREYDEGLAKRTAPSSYMLEDKRLTTEEYDNLSDEMKAKTQRVQDYNMELEERKGEYAVEQAGRVAEKQYNVKKGLVDKETEAKVDQTLAAMQEGLGIPASQLGEFREVMILEGIDTPSKLVAALKKTEASLKPEEAAKLYTNINKSLEEDYKNIDLMDEAEAKSTARSMGEDPKSRDEAIKLIKERKFEGKKTEALAFIKSNTAKKGGSLLSIDKNAKAKDTIKGAAESVKAGDLTIEELESKNAKLGEYVRKELGLPPRPPVSNQMGQYKEYPKSDIPLGPREPVGYEEKYQSILSQGKTSLPSDELPY